MSFIDWIKDTNNPKLPKEQYLYGTRHIIVLCIVAVLCVALSLIFAKRSEKTKLLVLRLGGGILLFFEIVTRIVNLIICEEYTLANIAEIILPMHICSVMVWIFIIAIFTKQQTLINFATVGGLLATLAFLLYPAVGLNKVYMSFTCIYSTVSHMIGFIMAILMMTLGFAKFEFKDIWKVFLCFAIMFAYGALLDFVIFKGADYMYLRYDPLELNLPFPHHFLYGPILIAYITLFYFIYWLTHRKKNAKKKTT